MNYPYLPQRHLQRIQSTSNSQSVGTKVQITKIIISLQNVHNWS
jgi:hypothetical protein